MANDLRFIADSRAIRNVKSPHIAAQLANDLRSSRTHSRFVTLSHPRGTWQMIFGSSRTHARFVTLSHPHRGALANVLTETFRFGRSALARLTYELPGIYGDGSLLNLGVGLAIGGDGDRQAGFLHDARGYVEEEAYVFIGRMKRSAGKLQTPWLVWVAGTATPAFSILFNSMPSGSAN